MRKWAFKNCFIRINRLRGIARRLTSPLCVFILLCSFSPGVSAGARAITDTRASRYAADSFYLQLLSAIPQSATQPVFSPRQGDPTSEEAPQGACGTLPSRQGNARAARAFETAAGPGASDQKNRTQVYLRIDLPPPLK